MVQFTGQADTSTNALEIEGSKSPLLRAPRAAGERNIGVEFADVTRIRRESGVNLAHMSRAKFAYDVRHVCRVSCKWCARNEGCYFWTPLQWYILCTSLHYAAL
jgi:hypothetical protein